MKIIKLNAIDSTNSFLKGLIQESTLENYTVVVTKQQTKGRGQQESKWLSEPHKNLTFSLFLRFSNFKITQKKYLNFAISLAVFVILSEKKTPKLSIKWPNDILSANKKICGLLIENSIKGNKIQSAVIGIGVNVNQEKFPNVLKNVTSLKIETHKNHDLEVLLKLCVDKIKEKVTLLSACKFKELEESYLKVLYKKEIPSMFKKKDGTLFMGKITGISKEGNLLIELEDESVKEFGLKEVRFI
jgi:BirA family biotin operon repressor/biotin-[acetyl-CoA-carboxylase] ligase